MKFKRKSFLSLALAGVLLVSATTEVSAYSIDGCMQWLQRSATTLFSSKSFQRFAPTVVLTGIALGTIWYFKSKKKKESLDTNGADASASQETGGNSSKSESDSTSSVDMSGKLTGRALEKYESDSEEQLKLEAEDSWLMESPNKNDFMDKFVDQVINSKGEQNSVDAEQQIDRMYLASGRVKVNDELIEGRACQLSKNVSVKQLAALHQNTKQQIGALLISTGGGEASCAYHAAKNAWIVLNWGKNISEPLNSTNIARQVCAMPDDELIGSWREEIIKRRGGGDGEWLDDRELDDLIANKHLFDKGGYSIIDNVEGLQVHEEKVKEIADAIQQSDTHVFFVNTGGENQNDKGQVVGRNGHWFAMILKKENGKRTYIVVDSKNIGRLLNDDFVKRVIETFEDEKGVADKLVLSRDGLDAMKRGINHLLADENLENGDEKSRKLQALVSRYQIWGDEKLPEELLNKIAVFENERF